MNFKNLIISAAVVICLVPTAYIVYYDSRSNPSLVPTWHSPIAFTRHFFDSTNPLKFDSLYKLEPNQASFRLWINPSFNYQSVIEVHFDDDGSLLSETYYRHDYHSDKIEAFQKRQRALTKVETMEFTNQLIDSQFIHIRPDSINQIAMDGTTWTIEANINNSYLYQTGSDIEDKPFVILRDAIIELTDKSLYCLQRGCNEVR